VDSEGWCNFCCSHTRRCLGNLLQNSLEEIWYGDVAKGIRNETLQGKMHETCAIDSCPLFHRINNLPVRAFWQQDYPSQLEIDLPNTHCNIGGTKPTKDTACIMCERGMPDFEPQVNRLDEVCEKLRPYTKYLKMIHVQGVAEPFWKDMMFDCLDKMEFDKYQNQIIVSTTTNGTIISKERMERWLSFPKTCTTFSIDAATPETYQKIRRLNAYDSVIKSLMKYAELRSPQQRLMIHNNINLLNIDEVVGMVEVAAEANVDEINFNPTYNMDGLVVSQENVGLFKKAESQIKKTAERLNVNATFLRRLTLDLDLVQIKLV